MRIFAAAIVFAPLLLGVFPAIAGEPVPLSPANAHARSGAATDTTDRTTYTARARGEVREWQRKLQDLGGEAKVKGEAANDSARNELNQAWRKTEKASHGLRTASANGWESAKASFEKASHGLTETWDKVHPEEK